MTTRPADAPRTHPAIKLGYRNPKYIAAITVTHHDPDGCRENQDYNRFDGS